VDNLLGRNRAKGFRYRVSFDKIYRNTKKDIFFGKLSVCSGIPLLIVDRIPKPSSILGITGYPETLIRSQGGTYVMRSIQEADPIGAAHLGNVDAFEIPEGTYANIHRPHRKFSAVISSGSVPDGYSGAPVIDTLGRVVAMHSAACSHPTVNNGDPIMVHVSGKELRHILRKKAP
jgi:hypothetical protein